MVFNLLAAQLPEQWAQIDLTGSGIYNISETSQDYLAGLEDDVVIHVLTDKDTLDTRIVRFLDIYADLSDHLTLEYTDPTVYPSALSQYGVGADTIVVTCEATGRQESFDISDIIGYDMMSYYYYGTYTETDFDGESLLTSAIDSVLTGVTRMVYETTGHNETAVPISVKERFTRL
ncbi:Replicative helicase inhibitor G39P N-terminal domain-containing protein, partial [Dysosmobacter welbionis]